MKSKDKLKRQATEKNWKLRSILTLVVTIALGSLGWWWKDTVLVRNVTIAGAQYADKAALLEMIHVDSSLQFFHLDPVIIADRVRRHPWVKDAKVRRYPDATLGIEVVEREPVVLLVGMDGRPERYLDAGGFQMPFQKTAVYDVPLVSGLTEPMHPTLPVKHRALLKLLEDLDRVPPEVDALVSEFEIDSAGEISMYTAPKPGRGSIQVQLGRDQFVAKLSRLHAFWHEAVLPKEDVDFASIDLRFDSQIITREVRLSQ